MRRIVIYLFGVIAALGGLYAIFMSIRIVGNRMACQTEERLKIEDSFGNTFEVEDTICSTLATDEAVSVYASTAAPKGASVFSGWRNKRTLIFHYGPERWDSPPLSITRPSPSTILISIPQVSEIIDQNRKWANISVDYDIGKVDYPVPLK